MELLFFRTLQRTSCQHAGNKKGVAFATPFFLLRHQLDHLILAQKRDEILPLLISQIILDLLR